MATNQITIGVLKKKLKRPLWHILDQSWEIDWSPNRFMFDLLSTGTNLDDPTVLIMTTATCSSTCSSRNKKNNTEELYMRLIVSKQQSKVTRACAEASKIKVTRARAEASKIKVTFMKKLREHGLSLEEIERRVATKFPPLADMDEGNNSDVESEDSY
ncbi:hypothetical protein PSTT_16924 [Puccinia striiformis]|uniref:Uncharacterized protein n=1 Tax=Puccinia striiformis TaxID=27350 RepID=A0A2S4UAX3_9BASI|nr:hypothetical protein PSTT_16924 [Puccinia striiformis]